MRSRIITGAFAVVTAALAISLGTGAAFAQGKGHGGDRGDSKGQQKKIERGQGQQQQKVERPQAQQRQQQRVERPQAQQRQQQRVERPQAQQQQQQPQWREDRQQRQITQGRQDNGRGNRDQQRLQTESRSDQGRGDQRRADRSTSYNNQMAVQPRFRPQERVDFGGNRDSRRSRTNNAWPNNYGYIRSQEVHARNAERQAFRQESRPSGRYADDRGFFSYRYYDAPDYVYTTYSYQNHQRWNDVLRNVVANIFGSNSDYYDNYYPQYRSTTYGDPYYQAYYGGEYYNGYPQYQSYAYDPYYIDNSGYEYGNGPQYYGAGYYPENGGSYLSSGVVISIGGDFGRQMSGQLLTIGYDQGYNDGLYASNAGYGNRYYSDPYVYEDTVYDPYSYSVGANRHCMSDGYELGYADAQDSGRRYDNYQSGRIDLVGVLIGSSLTIF